MRAVCLKQVYWRIETKVVHDFECLLVAYKSVTYKVKCGVFSEHISAWSKVKSFGSVALACDV